MKRIAFLGDSLARLRDFPDDAWMDARHQLYQVLNGLEPDDWKPMKAIGPGVREIRIRERSGAFRVNYLAARRLKDWKGWLMDAESFDNVFDALANTPAEAANLKARSVLLTAVVDQIKSWNVTQEAAAARLGITRPRLSDLLRGKLSKFSLDALVNIGTAAGLVLEIRVAKAA